MKRSLKKTFDNSKGPITLKSIARKALPAIPLFSSTTVGRSSLADASRVFQRFLGTHKSYNNFSLAEGTELHRSSMSLLAKLPYLLPFMSVGLWGSNFRPKQSIISRRRWALPLCTSCFVGGTVAK